jgi:dissimilatory sulfite reductase (desulfoviridin) alpha/beta subunit
LNAQQRFVNFRHFQNGYYKPSIGIFWRLFYDLTSNCILTGLRRPFPSNALLSFDLNQGNNVSFLVFNSKKTVENKHMKWTPEAEEAVKKVPFFVRKKVRSRIENEASEAGKKIISLADVKATQARYLNKMSSEIKGYQVDTCFGSSGCPNPANSCEGLLEKIENFLKKEDLLSFLKQRVSGDLKFHHELRVTLAKCPNACSQPQIKDIGVIGAASPMITDEECSRCDVCTEACTEKCISFDNTDEIPEINFDLCLKCGKCIDVCPTGTIAKKQKGFRVQLGGKLGRHPRLAKELDGIYSEQEVLEIVKQCVKFYKKNSQQGKRFADIFQNADFLKGTQ